MRWSRANLSHTLLTLVIPVAVLAATIIGVSFSLRLWAQHPVNAALAAAGILALATGLARAVWRRIGVARHDALDWQRFDRVRGEWERTTADR